MQVQNKNINNIIENFFLQIVLNLVLSINSYYCYILERKREEPDETTTISNIELL